MAGARQGWVEAPYAETPASPGDLAAGAIRVEGLTRDVRILPGVAQKAGGRPDVMRGEETIVLGLAAEADAIVCLPGTHSKWVAVEGGRITGFSTFMTGEVFALLAGQSILRHAVEAGLDVLAERDAFASGVEAEFEAPELVLNRLFALRAAGLLGGAGAAETTARLSGLVIGLEMAGARRLHPGSERCVSPPPARCSISTQRPSTSPASPSSGRCGRSRATRPPCRRAPAFSLGTSLAMSTSSQPSPARIPWPTLKRSLVAILRGIGPDHAEAVVGGLIEAGFEAIEIPLNSPEPFRSIELAASSRRRTS